MLLKQTIDILRLIGLICKCYSQTQQNGTSHWGFTPSSCSTSLCATQFTNDPVKHTERRNYATLSHLHHSNYCGTSPAPDKSSSQHRKSSLVNCNLITKRVNYWWWSGLYIFLFLWISFTNYEPSCGRCNWAPLKLHTANNQWLAVSGC